MSKNPFRRGSGTHPEDPLDAWLNARDVPWHDDSSLPGGESLAGSAREFHAWAESVQEHDQDAKGPADDLWNTILGQHLPEHDHSQRSTGDMSSTTVPIPFAGTVAPQSNRTRTQQDLPGARSGAWFSMVAAALVVLTLLGGAYIARNSGFGSGGGDGDGRRFAAQVGSPESSPSSAAIGCDVEPLTTDEIVAYVENPNSYLPSGVFGTPAANEPDDVKDITEGLYESPITWDKVTLERGVVAEQGAFQDAFVVADQYYACMTSGTQAQVWALLSPYMVQKEVLSQFPVYRDREEIRSYIESVSDTRFADNDIRDYADGSDDGRAVYPNPNLTDARQVDVPPFTMLADADVVMYIGEEWKDQEEQRTSLTGWDATALDGGEEQSNGTSLILVHSSVTDQWFVHSPYAPWG